MNIFIISENIQLENNQTWIIDTFAIEFKKYSNLKFTDNLDEADTIWIIGYNLDLINKIKNPESKKIITTIHHIDWDKIDEFNKFFLVADKLTTYYHVICPKIEKELKKLTSKEIRIANFWINDSLFYNIKDKESLRKKYCIPLNQLIVGSFQRDTEGKSKCMKPKLSKGPDIFIKIVTDMKKGGKNPFVVLTGRRRNYVISNLEEKKIPYIYYEMVDNKQLNELYNCLDLYVVSSRVEGGPRSILECGLAKVPIISTDVGISELILLNKSIYDVNNFITYKNAEPDIEYAYDKSSEYIIKNYIEKFVEKIFS